MRGAHVHGRTRIRLAAFSDGSWIDLADAIGEEKLSLLSGLLLAEDGGPAAACEAAATATRASPDGASKKFSSAHDPLGTIVCVRRSYVANTSDMGRDTPICREIFLWVAGTIIGPSDDIRRPSVIDALDYQGQLAALIRRGDRRIGAAEVLDRVLGCCVLNDITARDRHHQRKQWIPAKHSDGMLLVALGIVTVDEVDWRDLGLRTRVDGEIVQTARTSQVIFDIPSQIKLISAWTTLRSGDLSATGTLGGIGVARNPPMLLRDGYVVDVTVERVGTICNRAVDDSLRPATPRWGKLTQEREVQNV
ncbi:MAG: fumarylacetoacetate hydrolase family protein [Acidimicrobiales bacterium]